MTTSSSSLVKMDGRKEAMMSREDTHLYRQSPRRSYCPPRSYSRSTGKLENPPRNISPARLIPEQLCPVKNETTSPLPSPCATSCMQRSNEPSIVPSIKSEPLSNAQLSQPQQQLQLNVPELAIKSEHTTSVNRTIATSPPSVIVKSEDDLSPTTSPGLTTDLENFQDLSEWCHRARRQPSKRPPADAMEALPETDELNTPLIEQGEEFLFTSPTILTGLTNNLTQDDDDCYGLLSTVQPSDFAIDFYACADIQSAETTAQHDNNNVLFECDASSTGTIVQNSLFQGTAGYQQYFVNDIGGGDPATTATTTKTDHHVLNYSASTIMDNSFNIFTNTIPATISDGSECADVLYNNHHQQQQQQSTTPAAADDQQQQTKHERKSELSYQFLEQDDVEPANPVVQADKKNLRLDFSNLWMENKMADQQPTIDTPEVISTALAMENTEFNLVKFINDSIVCEELVPSAPRLEEDDRSQSASISNDPSYSTSEISDDEDYEPPWTKRVKLSCRSAKKPAKTRTNIGSKTSTSSTTTTVDLSSLLLKPGDVYDSELSNVSTAESVKAVVRRGRPPKRNVSISSESTNADTEVSRYRELRDKNNEASRRSRLNRKMKEQHLEREATDLETRNRKLKVRVAELDKLVNSMRNNLMQMLLKK